VCMRESRECFAGSCEVKDLIAYGAASMARWFHALDVRGTRKTPWQGRYAMTIPALFWWRCPSETEKTATMIYEPRTSKIEDIRKLLPIPMPPIPRHVIAAPVVS
jgi:hypothetical protein